jgi:methyltransferase-like protein
LLHEYLAGENNAFLFSEFLADAQRHELQYVCETDLHTLFDTTLSGAAQAALGDIEDPLQHEQWMDFVRMRAFRKSVLCRADVTLERAVDVDVFTEFFYSADLRLKGKANLSNTKPVAFLTPDNTELTVTHPLSKAALLYLQEVHPYTPDFTELYTHAAERVRDAGGKQFANARSELVSEWFSLYSYRAVYGHLYPCLLKPEWSERPKASALARLQAAEGWQSVASIRHQALSLDDFSSRLLQVLDGMHTVPELAQLLCEEVSADALQIPGGKQAQASGKGMEKEIGANVKHLLGVFARHGLLI